MALYHLSVKIISRGGGKSACAAAAYRSGEEITCEYDGITHDYRFKTANTCQDDINNSKPIKRALIEAIMAKSEKGILENSNYNIKLEIV